MTWADLLRRPARPRPRQGRRWRARRNPSPAFVTGIADDSRAVEPGNVFVALKGLHVDGARFATQAIERGAVAVVSEADAPPAAAVPWTTVTDARLALGAAGRRVLPASERRDAGGRHHRHQRQDDDRVSAGLDFRSGADSLRTAGDRCQPDRQRRARGHANHSRGAGRSRAAARDGRRRLRRVRDGSVVARLVAAAGRRHLVRGRGVHQPDARPSRLPRATWNRTSRPSAVCSRCCRRSRPA